jgi:hypothetical protein
VGRDLPGTRIGGYWIESIFNLKSIFNVNLEYSAFLKSRFQFIFRLPIRIILMKKFYLLSILLLLSLSARLKAQNNVYSKSIIHSQVNLRGGAINLGELNILFPSAGYVVVHFDGECYATVGDRIVVAASNDGNWVTNDGHVAIENTIPDSEGHFPIPVCTPFLQAVTVTMQ